MTTPRSRKGDSAVAIVKALAKVKITKQYNGKYLPWTTEDTKLGNLVDRARRFLASYRKRSMGRGR